MIRHYNKLVQKILLAPIVEQSTYKKLGPTRIAEQRLSLPSFGGDKVSLLVSCRRLSRRLQSFPSAAKAAFRAFV